MLRVFLLNFPTGLSTRFHQTLNRIRAKTFSVLPGDCAVFDMNIPEIVTNSHFSKNFVFTIKSWQGIEI